MPANFFSVAWSLATAIIIFAGVIVILAAVATVVAAVTRARQVANVLKSQAKQGDDELDENDYPSRRASHTPEYHSGLESSVVEMITQDGVHYIPVP